MVTFFSYKTTEMSPLHYVLHLNNFNSSFLCKESIYKADLNLETFQ